MKKLFLLLLSVAMLGLVACDKNGGNTPDPQPTPSDDYDPNGEADWNIYFLVNDTFLIHYDIAIFDTLHKELDCSGTTIRAFDSTKVADKAMVGNKLSILLTHIPYGSLRVIELPIRLKVGEYDFRLRATNKGVTFPEGDADLLVVAYAATSNTKVNCSEFKGSSALHHGITDPNQNYDTSVRVTLKSTRLPITFKMLK